MTMKRSAPLVAAGHRVRRWGCACGAATADVVRPVRDGALAVSPTPRAPVLRHSLLRSCSNERIARVRVRAIIC